MPGDTNRTWDAFVYDRASTTLERVSVAADGTQADGASHYPALSGDGRYVAFHTTAGNLVPDDTNASADVLVRDRATGSVERVSVRADGGQSRGASTFAAITPDGRFVAFQSSAPDLVPGDTNLQTDVFVHDRATRAIERVSLSSAGEETNGGSFFPGLSADGRYVVFYSSASNLVPGDTNRWPDVFVRDRLTGRTERVSVDSAGSQGDGISTTASISADGRLVAFYSSSTNLVAGDTNATWDVFVHDRANSQTARISVAPGGSEANGASVQPALSADGRYVAYYTTASNLMPGDSGGWPDVVVYDRATGVTERVSLAPDGREAEGTSSDASISADGRVMAFTSTASDLAPGAGGRFASVYVVERWPP